MILNNGMNNKRIITQEKKDAFSWITGIGVIVIVGILISGVLTYTSELDSQIPDIRYWSIYAVLGGVFLVGFLRWDEYDNNFTNSLYLFLLTGLGIACMIMVGFEGLIWFLLMPIAMQTVIFMSRIIIILYTVCLVLLMNILAYVLVLNQVEITLFLWLTNTVIIGGMYAIGLTIQIALVEQLRAQAEVERLNQQLQAYAVQSAELAKAQERNRVAQTLHDSIGHALTVISVHLEASERLIDHDMVEKAKETIRTAQAVTREGLRDVRVSVSDLQTDTSQIESKLSDALRGLISWTAGEGRSITMDGESQAITRLDKLPQQTQGIVLRAIQEGLTNALKHAQPTYITLRVENTSSNLCLTLRNNNPNNTSGLGTRSGLRTMGESIRALGWTGRNTAVR